MATKNKLNGRELEIVRIFNAPRNFVFKAFTSPEHLKNWWAPKGFTTSFCSVDLRVGGLFRYCMSSPDGKDFWGRGIYREIVVSEKLGYADCFTDENGIPVPPSYYGMQINTIEEAIVTIIFEEYQGKTKLTLHYLSNAELGQEREMAKQGWNEMMDKFEIAIQPV